MSSKRYLSVIFIACLLLSFFGCEWTFGYSGGWFFWLRGLSRIAPSVVLLAMCFMSGAFSFRGGRSFALALGIAIPVGIYFINVLASGAMSINTSIRDSILLFVQAILSGVVGYAVGNAENEDRWLLSRLAAIMALVAFWKLFIKALGIGGELDWLEPAWPSGIPMIFGYSWYLNDFLTRAKPKLWTIVALGGTTAAIVADFYKPIIFIALVGTLILVFVGAKITGFFKVVLRMVLLGAAGALLFFAADMITQRGISSRITETIFAKFLHQDYGREVETTYEAIERASGGRFAMWEQVFYFILERPVFGYGPNIRVGISGSGEKEFSVGEGEIPLHNILLEILLAVGVVGGIPYIIGVIWWYRLMLKKTVMRRVGFSLAPCTATVTALLAYGMVGQLSGFFTSAALLMFLMGISASLADKALKESKIGKKASQQVAASNLPAGVQSFPPYRIQPKKGI
jgi:O-antigen ligase